MKLLTIAIPAYNMEKHLSKCLDSVLVEAIQKELQVIVINDGSKDKTLDVANGYANKYPESVEVIDKPNGGWGSAINVAMQHAEGKYFKILDSDDWFDSQALIDFVHLLAETDVDLVATSFSYIYDDKEPRLDVYDSQWCDKVWSFADYLSAMNYDKHLPMASICFKTSILKENQIQVCDRYYADIDYNLVPLIYVKNVWFSQINLYRYYIGREGQSTSMQGYARHKEDFMDMCMKVVRYYKNRVHQMDEVIRKAYFKDLCNIVKFVYTLFLSPAYNDDFKSTKVKLSVFDEFLQSHCMELYKATGKYKVKGFIPFIAIWRVFHLNILSLRK